MVKNIQHKKKERWKKETKKWTLRKSYINKYLITTLTSKQ